MKKQKEKIKSPMDSQIDRQIICAYNKGKLTGSLRMLINDWKLRAEIEAKIKMKK